MLMISVLESLGLDFIPSGAETQTKDCNGDKGGREVGRRMDE